MVYGAEAVLPSDICHDSPRVATYVEDDNEIACQNALDVWMRSVTLRLLVQRYIKKTCVAIIAAELKRGRFKKVTWYYG